jgi:hypothetical protein
MTIKSSMLRLLTGSHGQANDTHTMILLQSIYQIFRCSNLGLNSPLGEYFSTQG